MANPRMTLLDLLSKAEQGADPDFLRDGLKLLAQELMDAEVTQLVGAGLHERSDSRGRHAGPEKVSRSPIVIGAIAPSRRDWTLVSTFVRNYAPTTDKEVIIK